MAMNKICTSIEQSKKLIELGIDASTADMYWSHVVADTMVIYEPRVITLMPHANERIPAWSFTALFSILPKGTRLLKSATDATYHCDCPKGNIDKWFDNPVDACVEMIVKLKEKGLM